MQIYVVQPGDSVNSIARQYNITPSGIIYNNQLIPPYTLVVGQALLLSDGSEQPNQPPLVSNGYAYPFISRWVLEQTLPFLTSLSVFSYGFTAMGDLVPPELDDIWMVNAALVNSEASKTRLFEQLTMVMELKGYTGINIDFEYIRAEDRDLFTDFVADTVNRFRPLGYTVSVALAPKTSADQPGVLYEGKDYPALGAISDYVLLMTYEWGYTYGPNMAVAPLNKVRQVVEYAVTEIPPGKIHLGIPNYGYDWPLPYVRGETAWSPFFNYVRDGITHEVWFEDVRSIQGKFNLIKEFGLQGAGYWQLMKWWRANWLLMEDNFQIV